jgi:hypothetical protein
MLIKLLAVTEPYTSWCKKLFLKYPTCENVNTDFGKQIITINIYKKNYSTIFTLIFIKFELLFKDLLV